MAEPEIDTDLIDEALLALMYLTLHSDGDPHGGVRTWKSYDWDAMARLHEQGLISDPVGKTKSVRLSDEGKRRCEEAYYRLFAARKAAN